MVNLIEHTSIHYAPRTWQNAKKADFTLAFALHFDTAGEILTAKASQPRYLSTHLNDLRDYEAHANRIVDTLLTHDDIKIINIAGNSLNSMKGRIHQKAINLYMVRILRILKSKTKLKRILSGGQTGVDFSAAVAASYLGINASITFPARFMQRDLIGRDFHQSRKQIEWKLQRQVEAIKREQP